MNNIFFGEYFTIREILQQIFIFGCYDRTQGASKLSLSQSKYDKALQYLRYFWSDKSNQDVVAKFRLNRFVFEGYDNNENYLWRSYSVKAFSPQDLNLYVFLLYILDENNCKSVENIRSNIDDVAFAKFDEGHNLTYQMLQTRLKDMADCGLVEFKRAPKIEYRLSKDVLGKLTSEELFRLHQLLFLWRDFLPLSSLGYNIQALVASEIEFIRGEALLPVHLKAEDIFLQNVLNDEIFYQLTIAIQEQRVISMKFFDGEEILNVVPLKIVWDRLYGRQYLFGASKDKISFIRRLDRIKKLSLHKKRFLTKDYVDCEKFLENIWCASLCDSHMSKKKVEIDFNIEKHSEHHIFKRLRSEKGFGHIEEINAHHLLFSVEVFDPYELIPWIRSFGRYAQVRPSKEHTLAQKLKKNFEAIESAYFNFSNWENSRNKIYFAGDENPNSKATLENEYRPKFFFEYRNAFFLAVTKACNSILVGGKNFDKKSLRKFLLERVTFCGKPIADLATKISSSDGNSIRQFSVFSLQNDSFPLRIMEEPLEGEFSYDKNTCDKIPFLLTTPEKRWLRTLLEDDEIFSFLLGAQLTAKLKALLSDIAPFEWKKIIVERGCRENSELQLPHLKSNLKLIFDALQKNALLEYKNSTASGKIICGLCRPKTLIYSPYLRNFQLSAIDLRDEPEKSSLQRMTVSNLSELKIVDDNGALAPSQEKLLAKKRRHETLKLAIKPVVGFNDIERAFMLFSTHEKSGRFDANKNIYYMDVKFYSFQVSSLIRKILSLGEAAVVLSPKFMRDSILRRLP